MLAAATWLITCEGPVCIFGHVECALIGLLGTIPQSCAILDRH